jgi:hypothetical protein
LDWQSLPEGSLTRVEVNRYLRDPRARRRCLEHWGGDGADRQGGHDQHGVPDDRGVEADLGLVQPEAVFAELESLLRRPVSQTARLSSRWVLSGVRSPECSAIVHPLRLDRPSIKAAAYLPACSHGSTRAKHGLSSPSSSARFRRPSPAPILAAAAASDLVVLTNA